MYKTALVHDWLITLAGAEKVLEAIYRLFPSPIYTIIADTERLKGTVFETAKIEQSFIRQLPFALKHYRKYLPLMPLAIEQFDLKGYDIVISNSHAVAKGVITAPDQLHIAYVHSPIRYAYDMQHLYLKEAGLTRGLKSMFIRLILHYIRQWDRSTADGVDYFIANSKYIARRIWKSYHRESYVIYPPVDVDRFSLSMLRENYFVTASRMVPYKKIDIIVEAFSGLKDDRLVVIGDGPEFNKIKQKAGSNVELVGWLSQDRLIEYLQRARAFVFAAEEDFGILPVEAQACGCPVIAYGRGGATETVIENKTGIFFRQQSPDSIREAVERFKKIEDHFDRYLIRRHAESFGVERFNREFRDFIQDKASLFFDGR